MSDQAETLRRLMQGRTHGETADERCPSIITFTECGLPGQHMEGLRVLQTELGSSFSAAGLRALLVDYGGTQAAKQPLFEELFRLAPQSANALARSAGAEGPWFAPIDANDPNHWREKLAKEMERSYQAVDVILVTAYNRVGLLPDSVYGPARANTLVVGPARESLEEAVTLIKDLRRCAGVQRAGLIVKQVSDGAQAREVSGALQAKLGPYVDVAVEYLGFFKNDKNILHTVRKPDFLINLTQEARSNAAVEMLSKRLREKYLDLEVAESGKKVGKRPLRSSRFRDEPARVAPGNLAGFWRILLGEVKA